MRNKKNIEPSIEKLIETMASCGMTDKEIAEAMEMNDDTLRYNFKVFLTKGRVNLRKKLKRKQIDIALKGNVSMLIWLGKQYLNQADSTKENSEIKVIVEKQELTNGTVQGTNQLP